MKLTEATFRHLLAKQNQQIKSLHAATMQMDAWRINMIESEVGELLTRNPAMTFREAMQQLGYWQN